MYEPVQNKSKFNIQYLCIQQIILMNPIGWIVAIKEGEPIYIESGAEGVAKNRKEFKIKPTL